MPLDAETLVNLELGNFVNSPGGKAFTDTVKDLITDYMDAMAGKENEDCEMKRLVGGIRFGRELLGKIYQKIELGKALRQREEERTREESKKSANIRRPVGVPEPNFPIYQEKS